jgi:hypothetical protein
MLAVREHFPAYERLIEVLRSFSIAMATAGIGAGRLRDALRANPRLRRAGKGRIGRLKLGKSLPAFFP